MKLQKAVIETFRVNNFYEVLQLAQDCDARDITKAYHDRSLELHPDRTTDLKKKDELKRKFQILSEVYQVLSNTKTRLDYDQFLSRQSDVGADHMVRDEISIKHCTKLVDCYCYDCRCSGVFRLPMSECDQRAKANVFIVDCDSCSNSIKIVLE